MGQNNRVKVVGYAQRVFYGDGIEYRNFSDDLVGNQNTVAANGNTSVFTFGNFVTTTNYQGRTSRIFSTNKFSNYYTLGTYNLLPDENKTLIKNNVNVTLNLDNSDLSNFVYFGSATEFIRVTLEKIITDWPASLYLKPLRSDGINTIVGDTVSNYTYDPVLNTSKFEVDTNFINNKFNINYLEESNHIGSKEYITSDITYNMNNKNQLSFSTKRNMLTNSADFYNLSYDYINDCLKAGIVFRREFYTDRDVEPENNLIFRISIIPFGGIDSPPLN